jgi:hypothetical protein
MRRAGSAFAAATVAALAVALFAAPGAHAAIYEVDLLGDSTAGNCDTPTPGDCPLRRAVTLANQTSADDVIVLTTNVQLSLAGPESENLNVNGDIDVSGNMDSALTIRSDTGMRKIDSAAIANYRLIDAYTSLTIEDVEITDGNSVTNGVGGGGVHFVGFDTAATLRLDNAYVHDNLVAAGAGQSVGGGVAASGVGQVEIVGGSRIENNVATDPAAGSSAAGGGVSIQGNTDLTVSDSTIAGNRAGTGAGPTSGRGGGIDFFNSQPATPNLVVTNSNVTGNRAGGLGSTGVIYRGGGIHAEAQGGGAAVNVDLNGGSVSGNFVAGGAGNAQGQGGGVSVLVNVGAGNGVLTVDGVTVSGNRAGGFDGVGNPSTTAAQGFGAGISTSADTTITGSTIEDNFAGVSLPTPALNLSGVGAGIYATDGVANPDLILNGTSVAGNLGGNGNGGSSAGGGIHSSNAGALTLSGARIVDNESRGGGGGVNRFIQTAGAPDSILDSTIAENRSGFQGGGINLETPRLFTITRSLVSGNAVTGTTAQGGGINAFSSSPSPLGELRLVNSTVTGNTAGDNTPAGSIVPGGGGIALGFGIRIDFDSVFSTIASNTVFSGTSTTPGFGRGGNIRYFNASTATAVNMTGTIVSGGAATGTGASEPNCSLGTNVTFATNGGNLEGLDAGGNPTTSCGFTNTGLGDQAGVNPLLGALADNGGPTLTRALLPGSPAIDAAPSSVCTPTALTTDQRGQPRPFPAGGACDVGAYELGDRDGDGLLDNVDNCPTQAGPPSNGGCPLPVVQPPIADQPTPPVTPPAKKCKKAKKKGKKGAAAAKKCKKKKRKKK